MEKGVARVTQNTRFEPSFFLLVHEGMEKQYRFT